MPESEVEQPQARPVTTGRNARNRSLARQVLPWVLRGLGLLVLLALSFLGVDIVGGLELMLEARLGYLIPAFSLVCLAVLMRMVAWVILARSLKLGYRRLRSYVKVFFIGWSAGLGLPRGATPLARAAVLASDKRSLGRVAVIEIADRLLLVTTLLILLVASGAYLSAESSQVLWGVGIGAAITAAAIPLLLILAWLLRPLFRRIRSYRWVQAFLDDMSTALKELRHTPPSLLAGLLALVLVSSLLTVTSVFLASRSLDVPLSYPALMAAVSVVGLAGLIPISINNLGPREGILTAAVAGAGFSSEAGVALGLLWFSMQAVTRLVALFSWFMRSAEGEEGAPLADEAGAETS